MTQADAMVLILSRNMFYRRMYYLAMAAFILFLCLIVFLSLVLTYIVKNPPKPIYFATDNIGRLINIPPVTSSHMTTDEITAYVIEAVESAYSYDYINYRSQLQNTERYFDPYGWQQYIKALRESNNLLALERRKQIVTATVVDKPRLLVEGLLSNAYAWKFEMPVLVTFSEPPYDEKSKYSNAWQVRVIVKRTDVLKGYKGLGIVQLIGSLVSTAPTQPEQISNVNENG